MSYLFDKLERLKENEMKLNENVMKIKEEQKQLEEEIEFEIEKQRRLELDGTITKLRTQVGEFAKNIEGEIMPNNLEVFYAAVCSRENHFGHPRNYPDTPIVPKEEIQKRSDYMQRAGNGRLNDDEKFITVDKFTDNLKNVSEEIKAQFRSNHPRKRKEALLTIPHEIKIYNDITPILTTMIGVMKKQQGEIKDLREQLDKCKKFAMRGSGLKL